jgi:3-mercaptopyruvate sulfurtransferase SseA
MIKKGLAVSLAVLFVMTGWQVFAQQYSADALKKIEELKVMSRDKKDMAESMPGIKKITADEMKAWLDQGKKFVLMDNRLASDYDKEHIPGAVRLAPDDLQPDPKLAAKFSKDDIIVNY